MLKYLGGHGVSARIFPAIDGATMDIAKLEQQGIYDDAISHKKFSRSLSAAEIATTLSHLSIHRLMIDENIPVAMVLEDDAMFVPGVATKVGNALRDAPPDWEVLQLYHDCHECVAVTRDLVQFPSSKRMPVGAAGYLIRKSGAEKMLANGIPICYPADSLMGRSPRWGVVLYGFMPPVVVQNSIFPTQIYSHTSLRGKTMQLVKTGLVMAISRLARLLRGSR